ncbi:hypothetical protein ZWY2020_034268 [Hordeum vulgare]|nr:hypothetical protein ZWY2020_034268 [Hordeum vulgare]
MDPKVLLDYINIWYEDPNTLIDDLKLPPGISHMVTTFINEAKWKEQQARQAKVAKIKKEKFLRQNLLKLTPDALADDSVPPGSSIPAEESVERTPSPKASKVKKMTLSASDVKRTRAAEKEAKKRKASSAKEETEAKRLKAIEETAPLDLVPLNVAPSYEMIIIDDPAKNADEELKDVAPEEDTDEEIQIDDSPRPFIPQKDNVQASTAPADETASATKPAEEEHAENPQTDEIQHSEQNPQDEEQADPTPPTEQEEEIP